MIRKATKEDNHRLLEVWQSAVKATHHFLAPDDFAFYNGMMPTFLSQAVIHKYCDQNGEIQAFLAVSGEELDMLFVHDDYRGQGVGKKMLMYAIDELKATKVDVNEQNEQAYGFYRKFGFKLVSRSHKDGMGKDYPILHLTL